MDFSLSITGNIVDGWVLTLPIKCDALLFWIVSRWSVLLRVLLTQVTPPDIQTAELSPRTSPSDIGHQYWHYEGSQTRGLDMQLNDAKSELDGAQCGNVIEWSNWPYLHYDHHFIIHWPWPLSSAPPIRIYVDSAPHIYPCRYEELKNPHWNLVFKFRI